jgi:predicted Zn-dependent peptidase
MAAFHRRYFVPNNIVLAVSGGFDRAAVAATLKQRFFEQPGWKKADVSHAAVPTVPRAEPRKLHVFEADTLQGWMVVGHLGRQGRQPDQPALEIANYILGGGGALWKRVHAERPPAIPEGHFYARLFNESRSKRGLTNDTSSYVPAGFRVPGLTYAVTLGRPESIAYLLTIIDQQWRQIGEDVSEADIDIARHALVDGHLQMRYAGAHQTALSLAEDRFFDEGFSWSRGYSAAIQRVTRAEVLAAAKKYYRADDLVGVLVGPIDRIRNAGHPLYKASLSDFGEVIVHPLN